MEDTKDLHFEKLWGTTDTTYHQSLKELWRKNFPSISDEELTTRVAQAVWVITSVEGNVVGVSTAQKVFVEQLKNNLYSFRCFIDPKFRVPGLVSSLLVKTRDLLEENFLAGKEEASCIGMITLIENERIRKFRNEAVWPASKMVYMGNSPKGYPIRVYYFKKAMI